MEVTCLAEAHFEAQLFFGLQDVSSHVRGRKRREIVCCCCCGGDAVSVHDAGGVNCKAEDAVVLVGVVVVVVAAVEQIFPKSPAPRNARESSSEIGRWLGLRFGNGF